MGKVLLFYADQRLESAMRLSSANLIPCRTTTRPSHTTEVVATVQQGVETDSVNLAENRADEKSGSSPLFELNG